MFKRTQDLKVHKTRMKHYGQKRPKRTHTTIKDTIQEKRGKMQDKLPKVVWKRFTESGELEHELEQKMGVYLNTSDLCLKRAEVI